MKYNFDTLVDRLSTNSLKYDFASERGKPDGLLPLWVADMDFSAPPQVLEDIQKSVSHGIFGYTEVKEDYYKPIIAWFESRFGFSFTARDVIKTPGVVYALALAIRAFTQPGDGVLIQTPVYYPFYEVIQENGREIVRNPLVYKDAVYSIDFEDFEQKIISNSVKLFVLCSPHNPVGRVWTKEELLQLNSICRKHNVLVITDEIHCDFVYEGHTHTCYGMIDEDAIIATAPSKTFNLAGLQVSNIIVKNKDLRRKLKAEMKKTGYSQLNTLGLIAAQSAYTHGAEWLDELKSYLLDNIQFVKSYLSEYLPKIRLIEPQGTYLLWLDFSAYELSVEELEHRMMHDAKLWLDGGTMFGDEGAGFQRVNIACPKSILKEALGRLYSAFGESI